MLEVLHLKDNGFYTTDLDLLPNFSKDVLNVKWDLAFFSSESSLFHSSIVDFNKIKVSIVIMIDDHFELRNTNIQVTEVD